MSAELVFQLCSMWLIYTTFLKCLWLFLIQVTYSVKKFLLYFHLKTRKKKVCNWDGVNKILLFQWHLMHTFGKSNCTDLTLPHRETVAIILKVIVITVNLLETYSKGSCATAAHTWSYLFTGDGKTFFCIDTEQLHSTSDQLF